MQTITPFLWFDEQAEEAAVYYTSVFRNSKIGSVTRYQNSETGEVRTLMVRFEIENQSYTALNGGMQFPFSPAVSFVINCASQDEIDELWEKLSKDGEIVGCGWLKDKYGVSWQIVPSILAEMLEDKDMAKASRVFDAMVQMQKIDTKILKLAYDGG
jgi:predicted 3-demethylubiquinone-9 3-methyltransferase (glyoxalase superfamily)